MKLIKLIYEALNEYFTDDEIAKVIQFIFEQLSVVEIIKTKGRGQGGEDYYIAVKEGKNYKGVKIETEKDFANIVKNGVKAIETISPDEVIEHISLDSVLNKLYSSLRREAKKLKVSDTIELSNYDLSPVTARLVFNILQLITSEVSNVKRVSDEFYLTWIADEEEIKKKIKEATGREFLSFKYDANKKSLLFYF